MRAIAVVVDADTVNCNQPHRVALPTTPATDVRDPHTVWVMIATDPLTPPVPDPCSNDLGIAPAC